MVREVRSKGVAIWLLSQSPDDFDQPQYNFAREMGLAVVFSCVLEKPRMLEAVLGVAPGSVTPFAFINDADVQVQVVVDAALLDHAEVNCHPLENTATTRLATSALLRFIEACGHRPVILPLDGAEPSGAT
jgi:hypothetical protein